MSKYSSAIVIGLMAGVAMSLLMHTFVFPEGPAPILYGVGTGVFFAYILANLAGNKTERLGAADERDAALSLTPAPGRAQLLAYREGYVGKMAGLNLAVDGKPFAQIKSPRFTSLSLPPGRHTLTCAFGGLAGPQSRAGSYEFEVAPGGVGVVGIGAQMGLMQGSFKFTPELDLARAKAKLDKMPMVPADVPEV